MIRYQVAQDVNLGNTSLPSINITPEGRAMGAVPGWRMMLDPSYMVSGAPRNRALPNNVTTAPSGEIPIGTFAASGQKSFRFYNDEIGSRYIQGTPAISPDEWSFVLPLVIPDDRDPGLTEFIRSNILAPAGEISLRIARPGSGELVIYEGQSGDRLRWEPPQQLLNSPTLAIFTFSTQNGLNLFVNGVLVDSRPNDKRPLTQGFGENQWRMMNSSSAHYDLGIIGALSTDLSLPGNAGYRRAIERFLMTKYGIAT